jgi:Rab GDP dissociation inhibitor
MYVPKTNFEDGLYISRSFDPTSHFENETEDVLRLYNKITGKQLDLVNLPDDKDEQ